MAQDVLETLRTNKQMYRQLCCDSSRICDLQQIAFVSYHKFSPPLRIDGEGSLPFSQGKTSFQCTFFTRARQASSCDQSSERFPSGRHVNQKRSAVIPWETSLIKVMSMSWQPMDTVFPACTIAYDGSKMTHSLNVYQLVER